MIKVQENAILLDSPYFLCLEIKSLSTRPHNCIAVPILMAFYFILKLVKTDSLAFFFGIINLEMFLSTIYQDFEFHRQNVKL